jgi:hypothetical protein
VPIIKRVSIPIARPHIKHTPAILTIEDVLSVEYFL